MDPLPNMIAKPLHIFPWWLSLLLWITVLLLLYILYKKVLKKYLQKLFEWLKKKKKAHSPAEGAKKPVAIGPVIKEIRNKYLKNSKYRKGLFKLSAEMKSYFEQKTGLQIEEMTAGEIEECFSTDEPGSLFREIELKAFSEKGPSKSDFTGICDHAENATSAQLRTRKK